MPFNVTAAAAHSTATAKTPITIAVSGGKPSHPIESTAEAVSNPV
jgi:hypothetical protein